MSEIKRALTDEEWAELDSHEYECIAYILDGSLVADGRFSGTSRHALAALALYQQSFGFTRDMVEAIRTMCELARHAPDHIYGIAEGDANRRALDAATRIAALLPPEE